MQPVPVSILSMPLKMTLSMQLAVVVVVVVVAAVVISSYLTSKPTVSSKPTPHLYLKSSSA